MKQVLFFAAFFLFAGISVQAQDAAKSCNKPCTPAEKAACSHSKKASADAGDQVSNAIQAAKADESIEMKTCENSGNVSFYKKDVCEKSGKVSYTEVEYMEGNGEFSAKASNDEKAVEAAPVKKTSVKKSSCSSKTSKSSCCSKSSKSSTASVSSAKKSGCCAPGSKKSCSSKS